MKYSKRMKNPLFSYPKYPFYTDWYNYFLIRENFILNLKPQADKKAFQGPSQDGGALSAILTGNISTL